MSVPSRLKRARLGLKSRAPDLDVFDLTSDTEFSPPPKRLKSDSPLFSNGFVKSNIKSTSSVSSGDGASIRSTSLSRRNYTLSVNNGFPGSPSIDASQNSVPSLVLPERAGTRNSSASSSRLGPHLPSSSHLLQKSERLIRQKSRSHTPQTPDSLPGSSRRSSNEFVVSSNHDQSRVAERETSVDHANASSLSTQSNKSLRSNEPSRSSARRQELSASTRFQGTRSTISRQPDPIPTLLQHTTKPEQIVDQNKPSSQFELVIPLSKDRLPFHLRTEWREKRERVLKDARTDKTAPSAARLDEIQKYVGSTGFSPIYNTEDIDKARLTKAGPKLVREIHRDNVSWDWDIPNDNPDEDTSSFDVSSLVHPIEQVNQVLTTRFAEFQDPPLVFANDVNDRRLNGKFQFVSEYIFRSGVRRTEELLNTGCSCGGACDLHTCECLPRAQDHSGIETAIPTYEINPTTGVTVLTEAYMLNEMDPSGSHFEISECNKLCGCYPDCCNYVVSRGRTVPLEIFQTAKCGFGVRSSTDIVRGQFIELYLGEVITQQELERREDAEEDDEPSYIYSLDWFTNKGCYHVDGKNFGSAMRFVNHSCDPNARNFTVIKNKADKNVYYLAFFAIKDIKAGEEICIDYSPQNAGVVEEEEGSKDSTESTPVREHSEDDGRARCYCGAGNCRKWLWRAAGRKCRSKKRKTTENRYDKE